FPATLVAIRSAHRFDDANNGARATHHAGGNAMAGLSTDCRPFGHDIIPYSVLGSEFRDGNHPIIRGYGPSIATGYSGVNLCLQFLFRRVTIYGGNAATLWFTG